MAAAGGASGPEVLPFACALVASVLYGSADFLGAYASRRNAVLAVTLLSQSLGLLAMVLALPWFPGVLVPAGILWGALAGITGSLGVWLLYLALAIGPVSTMAPLVSLIATAVPVAVGLLLGERPGIAALAGIVVGISAILLISRGGDATGAGDAPARARPGTRAWAIALGSGVLVGGFLVCTSRIPEGGGLWPLLVARLTAVVVLVLVSLAGHAPWRVERAAWPLLVGCGVLDVAANVLYLFAAQHGSLSLMATIVSLAPASSVILAQIVLRERLARPQQAGVALALLAVALLAQGPR